MKRRIIAGVFTAAVCLTVAVLFLAAVIWSVPRTQAGELRQCGKASWYGAESGSRTAMGAYFDGSQMTAAMPSRSMLGKRVPVSYQGRSVVVLISDIGRPRARDG